MQIQAAHLGDLVVSDRVVLVDVLLAGTVAGQQNSGSAQVFEGGVLHGDVLTIPIEPDAITPTIAENAVLDHAIAGPAKTNQAIGFVPHIPIMLQALVFRHPLLAIGIRKLQALENDALHRLILGSGDRRIVYPIQADVPPSTYESLITP